MRLFLEPQIGQDEQGFWLTVTVSSGEHLDFWVSKPARLAATTWEEANAEAAEQVTNLRKLLEGRFGTGEGAES